MGNNNKLMNAIQSGKLKEVKTLLKPGILKKVPDINETDGKGVSHLMLAIEKNNKDIVHLLLENGANYKYPLFSKPSKNKDINDLLRCYKFEEYSKQQSDQRRPVYMVAAAVIFVSLLITSSLLNALFVVTFCSFIAFCVDDFMTKHGDEEFKQKCVENKLITQNTADKLMLNHSLRIFSCIASSLDPDEIENTMIATIRSTSDNNNSSNQKPKFKSC